MSAIDSNELLYAICDLLVAFGPDGHVDGADEILVFVQSLLAGADIPTALAAAGLTARRFAP